MSKTRKVRSTTLTQALAHLKQLIALGAEFPDAVYSTSVAFELDNRAVELLEDMYDEPAHSYHDRSVEEFA